MSASRVQQNLTVNSYSGRPDSFRAEEESQYTLSKADGQWQWDRDAQQMSPHLYSDGQGGNTSRPFYPSQIADKKLVSDQDSRVQPQEQDMEIGYEDNTAPQTLEKVDRKFHDDIMKLTKEQDDAEDAENARHKERMIEINNQYQEKLSALRAQHATRREELLRKEAQARLQQHRLAGMSPYQNSSGPSDMGRGHHGHGDPGPILGEPQWQYGAEGQFDSYRQRSESFGRGRMQGASTRVPTPGGRVYNTGPRYY